MKVVLSLTTIPNRLSDTHELGIKSCIDSLVDQSYSDYEIHFNIPIVSKTTNDAYVIPEWLTNNQKVQIFRTDDYGPITKSLPTIMRLTDPEDLIIVVDDDLVYHRDMVSAHVSNQNKWPEYCVGYDGLRSRDDVGNFSSHFGDVRDHFFSGHHRNSKVDIIQHYKSASYKRRFFADDFFNFVITNYSWNDDLLIAAYMSLKKRVRFITYHQDDTMFTSHSDWVERGGVVTFPVLKHTHHGSMEGCNVYRHNNVGDNGDVMYKYIDSGYKT